MFATVRMPYLNKADESNADIVIQSYDTRNYI